jgi:hypothetical protein
MLDFTGSENFYFYYICLVIGLLVSYSSRFTVNSLFCGFISYVIDKTDDRIN